MVKRTNTSLISEQAAEGTCGGERKGVRGHGGLLCLLPDNVQHDEVELRSHASLAGNKKTDSVS